MLTSPDAALQADKGQRVTNNDLLGTAVTEPPPAPTGAKHISVKLSASGGETRKEKKAKKEKKEKKDKKDDKKVCVIAAKLLHSLCWRQDDWVWLCDHGSLQVVCALCVPCWSPGSRV